MNSSKTYEKLLQRLRFVFDASRPSPRYTRPYRSLAVNSSRPPAILQPKNPLPWTQPQNLSNRLRSPLSIRIYSNTSSPTDSSATPETSPKSQADDSPLPTTNTNPEETEGLSPPSYTLVFTCTPCNTRSGHRVSKQGYHHGAVLITCPGCKARHVISDHLGIFSDEKIDIEEIMKRKGQVVHRGKEGEDGDIEFWDSGSTSTDASPELDKQENR